MNNTNVRKYALIILAFLAVGCEFELPEKAAAFTCAEPTVTTSYDTDVEFFSASLSNLQNVDGFTVIFKYNGTTVRTFENQNTNSTTFSIPVTQRTGSYTAEVIFTNECQQNLALNRSEAIPEKPCVADPVVGWNQEINGFIVVDSRLYHGYFVDADKLQDIESYVAVIKNNGEPIASFSRTADNPDRDMVHDMTNRTGEISIEVTFKTTCGTEIVRANTKVIPLYIPMREIDGGTFNIGSREGDTNIFYETPTTSVTESDFAIGTYEVNVGQWNEVMGGQIDNQIAGLNEGNVYRMVPVTNVSWSDCQEFIERLNSNVLMRFKASRPYRLPTEAEWEYAAGGGSTNRTRFGNGSNYLRASEARYGQTNDYNEAESRNGSYPAYENDATKANDLGLYNMSGNVWEWSSDYMNLWFYGDIYPTAKDPVAMQSYRVSPWDYRTIKGGSYVSSAFDCRVARRNAHNPTEGKEDLGLRLAHD
jgi:formylglycine-generating enzyme required for sulfatase activity